MQNAQALLWLGRRRWPCWAPLIGLLLIELGLFCYSSYDPTIRFSPDWFPFRGWAYFLLLFGVVALAIGTINLLGADREE